MRILGAIKLFIAKILTMAICHAIDNIQINTGHCAFSIALRSHFQSPYAFLLPTVGPRVYPGCGLVRRGMQKTLGALLSWRFCSQRKINSRISLSSQRTSATARPMAFSAISLALAIKNSSVFDVFHSCNYNLLQVRQDCLCFAATWHALSVPQIHVTRKWSLPRG